MASISELKKTFLKKLSALYNPREAEEIFWWILEDVTGAGKVKWAIEKNKPLSKTETAKLKDSLAKLTRGVPVQHITGTTEFLGFPVKVTHDVLIPRPETEELMHLIRDENPGFKGTALDIGTGSGCIAIALKKHFQKAGIWAIDDSGKALDVARKNARHNRVFIRFERLNIFNEKSWPDLPSFDLIVSNPPYVTGQEKAHMHPNVLKYEPSHALYVTGEDPSVYHYTISRFAGIHLRQKGKIYLEINEQFGEETKDILAGENFDPVFCKKDLNQKDRFVIGIKK